MKKTKFLSSLLCLYLLSSSLFSAFAYTKDPTLCSNITGVYYDNQRTVTYTNLPVSLGKTWCAYAHDATWTNSDDISGTWTPGQTTYTTKPIPGTNNLLLSGGIVSLAVWHTSNNLTGSKSEDCDANVMPGNFDASGNKLTDLMCTNYKAEILSGNIITLTGLNNHSVDVWCGFTDDNWASYVDFTPLLVPGTDKYVINPSTYSYASGGSKSGKVTLPINGTLNMLAHSKATDKCTKTFTLKGTGSGVTSPNENLIKVFPCPASKSDVLTLEGEFKGTVKITILDLNGALVNSVEYNSINTVQINLSQLNLNTGIYLIKIENDNDNLVAKLLIK